MTGRKKILSLFGFLFAVALVLAPTASSAQNLVPTEGGYAVINDAAHHSTDPSDPDPAHHRPYLLCPTSSVGDDCVLTPVEGFTLAGYPVDDTGEECPEINYDPAHHSLDASDPDPMHHRPKLVCNDGVLELEPLPGFDLNGYPV